MDGDAWTEGSLFWTDALSAELDPRLLEDALSGHDEDVADEIPPSQLDYRWARTLTNIAPRFEASVPSPLAHPGLDHIYQMNGNHGAPPVHSAGSFETFVAPYAHQISPQPTLLGRPPPITSQVPLLNPSLYPSSSSVAPHNLPQPYPSHRGIFTPSQPHTRISSTNRPITIFAYKCEWVSADGQVCNMHFASDQNSIFRHLKERHQVRRVGTSLCRWGGICQELRHDTIARHVMTHVGVGWACSSCPYTATRRDKARKHVDENRAQCPGAHVNEVRGPTGLVMDVSPFTKGQ